MPGNALDLHQLQSSFYDCQQLARRSQRTNEGGKKATMDDCWTLLTLQGAELVLPVFWPRFNHNKQSTEIQVNDLTKCFASAIIPRAVLRW